MSGTEHPPGIWGATKETVTEFIADDAMTHAAALAFYTGLALAPIMTLLVWVTRFLGEGARESIANSIGEVIGAQAAEPLVQMMQQADAPRMNIAGLVSLAILIFSATGVFAQLQYALNLMWDVQPKPGNGVWQWVRKRMLSIGMLISLLFLLLASTVATTVVQAIVNVGAGVLPGADWLWIIANELVALGLFTVLFGVLFRYIPDARIEWNDVWFGAFLTALLFTIGRFVLSIYLGNSDYGSAYGAAAGSFLALLVWVYYTSLIVFFGAEVTQVHARRMGHPIQPDGHAIRVERRIEPA
jgi:membrane protein